MKQLQIIMLILNNIKIKLMRIFFIVFCTIFVVSFCTRKPSNRQAQQCFQKAVNSQVCSSALNSCYQNKLCEAQINTFPCDFMDNDYLFNGYCFNRWYQNAVLSKELISCLVDQCDLRSNSKHNMTKFFQCNTEVVEGMTDMNCDQECFDDLKLVMDCMQKHPVEQCYAEQRANPDSNRVITAIRQTCLQQKDVPPKNVGDQL